jgi:hypothetical protein
MTDILALDIATVTGWARGRVGSTPASGSIRFGKAGASENAIFAHAIKWVAEMLDPQPRPDVLMLEEMLPPGAKVGFTTTWTRDRLAGLHGIVRGVAHLRSVFDIRAVSVGNIRQHFIGERHLKRHKAKPAIVEHCRQLGWPCADDNAGDALAAWSYACSLIDPAQGLLVSPLFNKQLRVHVQ